MFGTFRDRRGSALLIVLGFLSFMVVSAVAFSLWMRSERMPSSALKRAVSARHLAKAALAGAIAELDYAIQDDPYPGVPRSEANGRSPQANDSLSGSSSSSSSSADLESILSTDTNFQRYFDYWRGRVFFPPNPADLQNGTAGSSRIADMEDTVSVLTLEALGYIPAPLVNDARILGRRTWSARWRDLNYDAGRYAFVALNLSDYFDVNRIIPDQRRTSAPDARISVGHLFNDLSGSSFSGSSAEARATQLGDLIESPSTDADIPFTSLLDLHLALEGGDKGMRSPFWSQVSGASPSASFYGRVGGTNVVAHQLFVTDSWYPSTNDLSTSENAVVSLNDQTGINQPFKKYDYTSFRNALLDNGLNDAFFRGVGEWKLLPEMAWGCLYDYLDEDSYPLSLCIPSVERIPMIAGFTLDVESGAASIKIKNDLKGADALPVPLPKNSPDVVQRTQKGSIEFQQITASIKPLVMFPFRHSHGGNDSFKVQPMARIYLAPTGVKTRQGESSKIRVSTLDSWKKGKSADENSLENMGVITLVGDQQTISIPSSMETGTDTLVEIPQMNLSFALKLEDAVEVKYTAKYESVAGGGGTWKREGFELGSCKFWPLTDEGARQSNPSGEYDIHLSVWLRVVSGSKTVDLVPAGQYDDKLYNNEESSWVTESTVSTGSGAPIMDFNLSSADSSNKISYDMAKWLEAYQKAINGSASGEDDIEVSIGTTRDVTLAVKCVDPRINWAPEDWYATQGTLSKSSWYQSISDLFDDGRHDTDVFMNTSDSEWLQSMGELAFIPRLIADAGANGTWNSVSYDNGSETVESRTARENTRHFNFAWKTYRLFDTDSAQSDGLFDLDIVDDDGRGPKVNPYTDSDLVMAAAIANTPYDWWAACTNLLEDSEMTLSKGWECAFNDNGTSSKITKAEILKICRKLRSEFRCETIGEFTPTGSDNRDWLARYDELWADAFENDGDGELFGVSVSCPITCADRKYLYSFWRNCFGNRQQLFLIFIRAESSAFGASGEGASASQLGSRAVALVWREPLPPAGKATSGTGKDRIPHKTRVLFYHQFE